MIRLLFVDDDPAIRRLFVRLFTQPTYQVDVADSGVSALPLLEDKDYDVIVSDYRMPRMDGGEFLARACDRRPNAVRILATAESDFDVAVKAVNRGEVFRLLRKPWDDDDLHFSIRLAMEVRKMRQEREDIVGLLDDRTQSLARINDQLQGLNHQLESRIQERTRAVVDTLVAALDYRDDAASDRARRIAAYARRLGVALGLSHASLVSVEQGALLHDVGKLGVRDALFFKPGPLDDSEWAALREHPRLGARLLHPIEFLEEARRIVLHHRETWDGTGYPAGVAGEAIALGARIFAVAELLDSVLDDPFYAGGTGYVVARAEIQRGQGRLYDPTVVDAFLSVPSKEWLELCDSLAPRAALLEVA